jgi:hypothetical protein
LSVGTELGEAAPVKHDSSVGVTYRVVDRAVSDRTRCKTAQDSLVGDGRACDAVAPMAGRAEDVFVRGNDVSYVVQVIEQMSH